MIYPPDHQTKTINKIISDHRMGKFKVNENMILFEFELVRKILSRVVVVNTVVEPMAIEYYAFGEEFRPCSLENKTPEYIVDIHVDEYNNTQINFRELK